MNKTFLLSQRKAKQKPFSVEYGCFLLLDKTNTNIEGAEN